MSGGDKKHFGRAAQGKHDGSGAMTELPREKIGENMVLSNRDKKQHSKQRGMDGRQIQNEQLQDHAGNHADDDIV